MIVEDDAAQAALLSRCCEQAGYRVSVAGDGQEALAAAREATPDLVLLDWGLPRLSGLETCRHLRRRMETRDVPIFILTARSGETEKVTALDAGADDFISKPYSVAELQARMRAHMRRVLAPRDRSFLRAGDLEMDTSAYRVTRNGETVHLGPTEFRLLRLLMSHPGQVFSRQDVLDVVWGPTIHVEMRSVDAHIRRLRKALNAAGGADIIRTVRAVGYAIDVLPQPYLEAAAAE